MAASKTAKQTQRVDVQPELVAATNDSSIKSKRSMVRLGYFDDKFGRAFVPHPSRRSPLINRGYYIRAAAVSKVIKEFLSNQEDSKSISRQIISVGAGFDTTFFRLESKGMLNESDRFFEIDFPPVMQRKVEIVKQTPELNRLAPYLIPIHQPKKISKTQAKKNLANPPSNEEIPELKFSPGKLIPVGCDLAKIDKLQELLLLAGIDLNKPTLILSECVLTYMFPETSSSVISWGATFKNAVFIMYEQTYPNDGFGEVMTKHFNKIGSPLRSINEFPSISLYQSRFLSLGWSNVQVHDMNEVYYNVLEHSERERIDKIEPFDEFEEWHLKCSHYFVLIAQTSSDASFMQFLKPHEKNNMFATKLNFTDQPVLQCYDYPLFKHQKYPTIEPRTKITSLQRWSHAAAQSRTKIVSFGGFGGNKHSRLNDICLVNPCTWEITTPAIVGVAPTARIFHSLTYWNDEKFLLFGGRAGTSKPFNDVHCIDADKLTWELIITSKLAPAPRWRHCSVLCDSNLLVIGGRDQSNVFSCVPWVLDLTERVWKELEISESPAPRHSHSCTPIGDNKFLLIGGLDSDGIPLQDVWIFQFAGEKSFWQQIDVQSMHSFYRYSHSAVSIAPQKVLMIGGISPQLIPVSQQFIVFDLATNTWNPLSDSCKMPTGTMLNKQSAHFIDNKLILLGGGGNCFSFGSHFNSFLSVYSPDPIISKPTITNISTNNKLQYLHTSSQTTTDKVKVFGKEEMSSELFTQWIEETREPFIIRGNTFGNACEKWKDAEYLKKQSGTKLVSVHQSEFRYFDFVTKNYQFIVQPFEKLVENTLQQPLDDTTRYYLRSLGDNARRDPSDIWQSFPELLKDFELPEWFPFDFPSDERYFSSVFRIGSRDMQLWTHYDMMDNILCHVSGTKHVTLWNPSLAHRMYLQGSSSSVVRIDEPDKNKYPMFPYDDCLRCTLLPGDLLFIPSLWFHNIHAEDPCISVNLFWRHLAAEFYEKKDLFGNKDLSAALDAMRLSNEATEQLQSLPPYYRDFYARLAISELAKHLHSPL